MPDPRLDAALQRLAAEATDPVVKAQAQEALQRRGLHLRQAAMEQTQLRMAQDQVEGIPTTGPRVGALSNQALQSVGAPTAEQAFAQDEAAQQSDVGGVLAGYSQMPVRAYQGLRTITDDTGLTPQRAPEDIRAIQTAQAQMGNEAAANPIASTIGGAIPFAVAAPLGIPASAVAIGAAEGLGSYGEARQDMRMDPGAAALRAGVQGTLAGASMAVNPLERAFGATALTRGPLAAGMRSAAVNAADAIPQSLVYDYGGAAVDVGQGKLRGDAEQEQRGIETMRQLPEHLPEMLLAGGIMGGGMGAAGHVKARRAEVDRLGQRYGALPDSSVETKLADIERSLAESDARIAELTRVQAEEGGGDLSPDHVTAELASIAATKEKLAVDRERALRARGRAADFLAERWEKRPRVPDFQEIPGPGSPLTPMQIEGIERGRMRADDRRGQMRMQDEASAQAEAQRAQEGQAESAATLEQLDKTASRPVRMPAKPVIPPKPAEIRVDPAKFKEDLNPSDRLTQIDDAIANAENELAAATDMNLARRERGDMLAEVLGEKPGTVDVEFEKGGLPSQFTVVGPDGVPRAGEMTVDHVNAIRQRISAAAHLREHRRTDLANKVQTWKTERAKIADAETKVQRTNEAEFVGDLKVETAAKNDQAKVEWEARKRRIEASYKARVAKARNEAERRAAVVERRDRLKAVKLKFDEAAASAGDVEAANPPPVARPSPSAVASRPAPAARGVAAPDYRGILPKEGPSEPTIPDAAGPIPGPNTRAEAPASEPRGPAPREPGDGEAGGEIVRQRTAEVGEAEARAETSRVLQAAEEAQAVADRKVDLARARLDDLLRAEDEAATTPTARADLAEAKESQAVAEMRRAVSEAEAEADAAGAKVGYLRRLAEIDVQRRQAGERATGLRQEGAKLDAERANIDSQFAQLHTSAKDGVAKAKIAGATAKQKTVAVETAGEAVRVAGERVSVAKAKLADLNRTSDADPETTREATIALREAQLDLDNARATKLEADNLVKATRRDVAQGRVDAETQERVAHANRLREEAEKGLQEAMGPSVKVEVLRDGNMRVTADGKRLFDIIIDVEPHTLVPDDFQSWWESMGGRDGVRRWLSKAGGETAEGRGASAAKRLLDGKVPRAEDGSDIAKALTSADLVKFMSKFPVHASYERGSGNIRLHASVTAADLVASVSRHEGNHKTVHAIMLAAVRSPEMAQHVDTLVRATGIDPRSDPRQTTKFLEEVQRRYAAWRKGYNPEAEKVRAAKAAADVETGSRFDKAMRALGRVFEKIARWFGAGQKDVADLSPLFKDMAEGRFLAEIAKPGSGEGRKAFATKDLDEPVVGKSGKPVPGLRQQRLVGDVPGKVPSLREGEAPLVDTTPKPAEPKQETIFATRGIDEESIRRPLRDDEESPNRSMGGVKPEYRKVMEKARRPYEMPDRVMDRETVDAEAMKMIESKGIRGAVDAALAEAKRLRSMDAAAENPAMVAVLEKRLNQLGKRLTEKDVYQGTEINEIQAALSELKGNTAANLANYRDRYDTPAHRAESVQRAFLRMPDAERMWFRQQRRRIDRAEKSEDPAAANTARKVFEAAMTRYNEFNAKRLAKMKKWGIDVFDTESLTKALDGENFATVIRDIDDMSLMAKDNATWMDWLQANHRANLLGDLLVTQPAQLFSNMLSAVENTGFHALFTPGALREAIRSGAIKHAAQNAISSFKEGRNAWAHKISGEELGRFEDHYRPNDVLSRVGRMLSFDIMAAIDGGFQRYNAQLAAAAVIYKTAKDDGMTHRQAIDKTRSDLQSELSGDVAVEALFRSLPQTFQDLSLTRPGADRDVLDKAAGLAAQGGSVLDEWLGKVSMGMLGRNAITGEAHPIPVSKIALPFVRTPLALARAAMRRSFLGAGSTVAAARKVWDLKKSGSDKRILEREREQLQRRIFESVIVGGIAMHALAASLDATGVDIDDDEAGRTGRSKAEKTVELFGKRIPYARLEPFATPLAMAADGIRALKAGKNPAAAELGALLKLGSDLAWFRLIAGVGQTVQDVQAGRGDVVSSAGRSLLEWAGRTAVTMTPGLGQGSVRAALKPGEELTRTDERGFVGAVTRELGFNYTINRDVWGRKVTRGPGVGVDTPLGDPVGRAVAGGLGRTPKYQPTAVDTWLESKGVKVPGWHPEDVEGARLKSTELDEFVRRAGPRLLSALERLRQSRPNASAAEIEKALGAHKRAIGRLVRREMSKR